MFALWLADRLSAGLSPMLDRTLNRWLSPQDLASAPAVWGKLPEYGDYVRWNSTTDEGAAWQRWVQDHWLAPAPRKRHGSVARSPGGVPWLSLEPAAPHAHALWGVPIAFVLAPGSLDFAPEHYVQGVLVDSQDRVGRACPLIIYQRINRAWFVKSWSDHFSARPRRSTRHLLFWEARLAARIHAQNTQIDALGSAIDALWQSHAPSWRQQMGVGAPQPDPTDLADLVQKFSPYDERDTAHGLNGVPRLPWHHGLARVIKSNSRTSSSALFWQQDPRGGYVNAAERWEALWTL